MMGHHGGVTESADDGDEGTTAIGWARAISQRRREICTKSKNERLRNLIMMDRVVVIG